MIVVTMIEFPRRHTGMALEWPKGLGALPPVAHRRQSQSLAI